MKQMITPMEKRPYMSPLLEELQFEKCFSVSADGKGQSIDMEEMLVD